MSVIQESTTLSIKTILFATDFSATSQRAEVYAKAFAHHFGSTVEITHVFNPSVVTSYEEAIIGFTPSIRESNCEKRLRTSQRSFANAGIKTKVLMSQGHSPAKELLKIAKESSIDLIVAGTESKTGIERLLLGSTADQLVRNAACPVLTVGPSVNPPVDGHLSFKRILYVTDYSPESAKSAIFALSLAENTGARLIVCHVKNAKADVAPPGTVDEPFEHALARLLPRSNYDWRVPEYLIERGKSDEELLMLATQVRADVIVLGARRSSFWLSDHDTGLTRSLLAKAPCPILTVPPAQ